MRQRDGSIIARSALELVGNTPMVVLERAYRGPGCLLAKAEFMQPGGSVKDRAAKAILSAAISDGRLKPGMPVVEMTSGNMGAGLAVACAALGHQLILTMSAGNSAARVCMVEGMGAEVIRVDQVDGRPGMVTGRDIDAAAQVARRIAKKRNGFYVDQFNRQEAVTAHKSGTGAEILRQTHGRISAWVAAVGTGSTFMGVARALRAASRGVLCVAVEPAGSRPLAGEGISSSQHLIQGIGYGLVPPHWDPSLMDLSLGVTDDEAVMWRQKLAKSEGLYVGYSGAANVCAAVRLLESGRVGREATVVTVLCDTGLKY